VEAALVSGGTWKYVARKTWREFNKDSCTDLAAALTYYGVLALFPAIIALVSLIGIFGQGPDAVTKLLDMLRDLGAGTATESIEPTVTSLSQASDAATFALIAGLATALWSSSAYVAAFGRSMNRIYGVGEGRPFWKLRPLQLLVTFFLVVMAALVALSLVLTGEAAEVVGDAVGLGDTAVLVWDIAKWPVMLAVVTGIVATLYYATPNVKQPSFKWISPGAAFAILVWLVASAGFGFYASQFGNYNKTYGTLAGVIVFLLWLWLTNVALLFGAELDSELERSRELEAGLEAETELQLPLRDTRNTEKAAEKDRELVELGRELRESAESEDADKSKREPADAR
jgi:membrane protein